MPVTIQVNGGTLSLVHKMSNGISTATIPDVCKTPSPGGPVPVPYPNIAQTITLTNGTTTVKGDKIMTANKGSKLALSNGDNAGTVGGVKSNVFMKEATWILYSFNVKLQGKNACRLTDKMFHNAENCANLAGVIQALVAAGLSEDEAKLICQAFCEVQEEYDKGPPPDGSLQGPGCCSRAFENRINALKSQGRLPNSVLSEETFFGARRLTPGLANRLLDQLPFSSQMPVIDAVLRTGMATTAGGSVVARIATPLAGALRGSFGSSAICRPDLIVEAGGNRSVFDAKFSYESRHPGSRDTMKGHQRRAYRKLSKPPGQDPQLLTPESCGC